MIRQQEKITWKINTSQISIMLLPLDFLGRKRESWRLIITDAKNWQEEEYHMILKMLWRL